MEVISRFGDELEYDLHRFLHLDLLDFFRGVLPWGKLARLILRLPWYSDYKRALEDDLEFWTDYYAGVEDANDLAQSGGGRPSLTGWDEYRELAADLKDQISQQTISLLGPHVPRGKPRPKFKPVPRPKPARVVALEARQQALDDAMEAEFMGMLAPGTPTPEEDTPDVEDPDAPAG